MSDTFMEKTVIRRKGLREYLIMVGSVLISLIVLAVGIPFLFSRPGLNYLSPVVIIGLAYGLWFVLSNINREFEYCVTNGALEIDLIISKRKRERVFAGSAITFRQMGRADGDDYEQACKENCKMLDCSTYLQAPDNWFILSDYRGQLLMIIFEPDEQMINHLTRYYSDKSMYLQHNG